MTKTVASLCPWPVAINRPHFTLRNEFALPAAVKGGPPVTIRIEDNIQWEKLLSMSPPTSKTILGEEIANDFVLHVAHSGPFMTEDARPAVWVCQGPEPTAEEIASELGKLKTYCGLMVEYADDLDRRRQSGETNVPKITERMKECCRFLNLKREWLTELINSSTVCPFCTVTVPAQAVKCPNCKETINRELYEALKKNGGKLPESVGA